jgi:hypothetical protein
VLGLRDVITRSAKLAGFSVISGSLFAMVRGFRQLAVTRPWLMDQTYITTVRDNSINIKVRPSDGNFPIHNPRKKPPVESQWGGGGREASSAAPQFTGRQDVWMLPNRILDLDTGLDICGGEKQLSGGLATLHLYNPGINLKRWLNPRRGMCA